jgi:4-hydroxybenzoate polyprenyltransferase
MEAAMIGLPEKGYFRRMRIYLKVMYPPSQRFISAAICYVSFVALLGRIHSLPLSFFSLYSLLGTWNIFALLMILRLMDELKDKEIDLDLFKERPVPSGKVLESDISFSLTAMIFLYLTANIWTGKVFWMAAAVLAYALLMFKYFFIPRILRKHLLLNLATHNPIVALMLFHVVVLFSAQYNLSLKRLDWNALFLLVIMFWAMFFAWEIGRKIRSKEEENEYVTYSQIFGRNGAVLVTGGAQTITFIIALYFLQTLSLSWVFVAILATGYALTMWAHLRFVLKPNPATSKLRSFGERYIVSVFVAFIVDHFLIG